MSQMKNFLIAVLGIVFIFIASSQILLSGKANNIYLKFKAQNEIPVSYTIDQWNSQTHLDIDQFDVNIIQSNLNMFNNKSLISYTVEGHITSTEDWKHEISHVYISDRLNNDSSLEVDRIFEIIPIVGNTKNKKEKAYQATFNFTNKQIINTSKWANNKILFICGEHREIIELYQDK